ncbi:glycosyltransferase family 2 protein [Halovivax gelatinilyticus]|uniref:glycosyltransferase family 2 protein n=1 Tax=Halovivax gelatinilyticus TaxID=2961597 RepID=UPI0020CA5CFA|nr:glycosyltransferase family 2 protein [Halovivax gelatinilyticus]
MYDGQTVGVVIPAYNESGFVGDVIETLPAIVDRAYVVDDCSTDDTWSEIEAAVVTVNERSTGGAIDGSPPSGDAVGRLVGATEDTTVSTGDSRWSRDDETDREFETAHPTRRAWRLSTDGGRVRPDDAGAKGVSRPDTTEAVETPNAAVESDSAVPGVPRGGAGAEDAPQAIAVRHDRNRGVGGAIKTGYQLALADGIDVVAVMNGDGQMDPAHLAQIVEPVTDGRAAYAKGNRLSSSTHRESMPTWRLFGNGLLTGLTRCVSGYWGMSDPQNGYTAISREALEAIEIDRLYEGYGFCNDVLVHLNVAGFRIEDVPMAARYGDEQSHIRYSRFVPSLSWLLVRRAAWRYGRQYVATGPHPLAVALIVGVLAGVSGLVGLSVGLVTAGFGSGIVVQSLLIGVLGAAMLALAIAGDRWCSEPFGPDPRPPIGGERT